jgi:hypothetical protein
VLEDTAVTSDDLRAAGITDEQLLGVELDGWRRRS